MMTTLVTDNWTDSGHVSLHW